MEATIKNLKEKIALLEYEELNDIVSLAIDIIVHATAKSDSKLSDLSRQMENHKAYENIKNKSIREIIGIGSREIIINNLNKYSPTLYNTCLNRVKNANIERSHTISVLLELSDRLSQPLKEEILEFSSLKSIFDSVALNPTSQIAIFIYIIKNNARIHAIYQKNACIPNIVALINHKYKYITIEEVASLLVNKSLDEFFNDKNPQNPDGQKELQDFFASTCIDCSNTQECCQKLDAIFSQNIATLTEESYEEIITHMRYLSLDTLANRLVKQIRKQAKEYQSISALSKLIGITSYDIIFHSKNLPKITINVPLNKTFKKSKEENKPKHSQRELNQVHYEISKLFDLEAFKPKTTLSLDEIIYLLSLMYSIDMPENTLIRFLDSAMRSYHKQNPFCIFYQSYNKFKSYELVELQEHLEMIEYILSEVNIFTCSEDEYCETKELVQGELNAIIDILAGNYDYEKKKAKELLKEREAI